jgi:hypothetical protein
MEAVWLALVVGFFGVLTASMPVWLARQASAARAAEKAADYARQDVVAAKVEEAAKAAREVSQTLAATTKTTNDKLDVIHTLVNSNMTAALQAEYDATTRELAMMHEVIEVKKTMGREPTEMALAAIKATEEKLGELRATLDDRLKQAKVVEVQQSNQQKSAT